MHILPSRPLRNKQFCKDNDNKHCGSLLFYWIVISFISWEKEAKMNFLQKAIDCVSKSLFLELYLFRVISLKSFFKNIPIIFAMSIYLFKVNHRNTTKVWNIFQVNKKYKLWPYLTPFSTVSVVGFEQVNSCRTYI